MILWGIADEDEGKLHDNTTLTVKHNHGEKYTIMSENKNKQKTATGWESSGKMISTCFSKSGISEVEFNELDSSTNLSDRTCLNHITLR